MPAPQRRQDRQAEMRREVLRLIEAPPPPPECVQRNRNGEVGASEPVPGDAQDELRQGLRKGPPAVVLEGVHDLAQRAGVHARCPACRPRPAGPLAAAAQDARAGFRPRDPDPAAFADARFEAGHVPPARWADDAPGRGVERNAARGATRGPGDREDRVERSPKEWRRVGTHFVAFCGATSWPPSGRSPNEAGISMRVALPHSRSRSYSSRVSRVKM